MSQTCPEGRQKSCSRGLLTALASGSCNFLPAAGHHQTTGRRANEDTADCQRTQLFLLCSRKPRHWPSLVPPDTSAPTEHRLGNGSGGLFNTYRQWRWCLNNGLTCRKTCTSWDQATPLSLGQKTSCICLLFAYWDYEICVAVKVGDTVSVLIVCSSIPKSSSRWFLVWF